MIKHYICGCCGKEVLQEIINRYDTPICRDCVGHYKSNANGRLYPCALMNNPMTGTLKHGTQDPLILSEAIELGYRATGTIRTNEQGQKEVDPDTFRIEGVGILRKEQEHDS